MACFGHVVRHDSLSQSILQGTIERNKQTKRTTREELDRLYTEMGLTRHAAAPYSGHRLTQVEEVVRFVVPCVPLYGQMAAGQIE